MRHDEPVLGYIAGLGVTVAALALYGLTLAPTVLEADGGEFQFVPWLPGIAHPTGYPLYTLLGWLWIHIFRLGEVAWRMNLLSALFGAGAVGLTYFLARAVLDEILPQTPPLGRVIAAAGAAASLAVSHTFWSQALIAEVYTLHAWLMALSLGLALKWRRAAFEPAALAGRGLFLTLGLGLAHHRTTVLLLPGLLAFWLYESRWGNQPVRRPALRVVGESLLLMAAPLLLYLYLPLIAPYTPYATLQLSPQQTLTLYHNSLSGFIDHVAGAVFSSELRPAAVGFERLVLTWQLLRQQFGWAGVGLGACGLLALHRSPALLLLTGLTALSFAIFNLIYFIGDVFVLFIPVWLIVALWIGCGGLALTHGLANRLVQGKVTPRETVIFEGMGDRLARNIQGLIVTLVVFGVFLFLVGYLTIRNSEVSQATATSARARWLEILAEPIPPQAVLLSNDRNEIMPLWYYQYVERRRPDLLGLFPLIVTDPAYANIGRVLDEALRSGRPVYLIKPMAGLELKAEIKPEGSLYRVRPMPLSPTYPLELALPPLILEAEPGRPGRTESIALLGYDLQPDPAVPGAELRVTLYWQVSQALSHDYTSYVHLVNTQGQGLTQSDHRSGGVFYPSSLWRPGEILRDQHRLNLPVDLPAGAYSLRVGLYYQPEPGLFQGMGEGVRIGPVSVTVK